MFGTKTKTVEDLMLTAMTYVLDFEQRVSDASEKMADASTNPEVKAAFQKSMTKGKEYGQKIEMVFAKLGKPAETNTNHIAKAMVTEVEHMISDTDAGAVRDAALIVAANQQQHFRIASYGSLETYAKLLGKQDAAQILHDSLEDSKGGDAKLTKIAEETVNPQAAHAVAA